MEVPNRTHARTPAHYMYTRSTHSCMFLLGLNSTWGGVVGGDVQYVDGWLDGVSGREIRSSQSLAIKSSL